jgi:DNA-binding CsgD family transcriptional regulator
VVNPAPRIGQPDERIGQPSRPAAVSAADDQLTPREAEILEFERQWWRLAGAKEQAVADRFGLSSTRYYQLLNGLIDRPAALRADPMLVKRLQRLRLQRERARSARRLGQSV